MVAVPAGPVARAAPWAEPIEYCALEPFGLMELTESMERLNPRGLMEQKALTELIEPTELLAPVPVRTRFVHSMVAFQWTATRNPRQAYPGLGARQKSALALIDRSSVKEVALPNSPGRYLAEL